MLIQVLLRVKTFLTEITIEWLSSFMNWAMFYFQVLIARFTFNKIVLFFLFFFTGNPSQSLLLFLFLHVQAISACQIQMYCEIAGNILSNNVLYGTPQSFCTLTLSCFISNTNSNSKVEWKFSPNGSGASVACIWIILFYEPYVRKITSRVYQSPVNNKLKNKQKNNWQSSKFLL